jgi:adenine deaminase
VHGFGMQRGAIASSLGHDSHNMCVVILLTDMVETWGALGAEPAMLALLRKVAA